MTDPTGKQRKTDSDALGRLISVWEPDPANGNSLSLQTSYLYTSLDALASVSQGVQSRAYNYDDLGRVTSQATPEGGNWQFTYTNFSQVYQRTDARGVITTYGYDGLNRLQSISYNVGTTGVPATSTVTFYYDEGGAAANALGRLTHFTDGAGSETFSYDVLGQATQVSKVINGATYATGYSYNLAGEATQVTYPSGRTVVPSYDAIGRLAQVASGGANYTSGYAYNPAFQVTGMNYGNGVSASFGYSADRLQMTSLSYTKNTTTLFSLNYGYTQGAGNNGQITSIADNVDNGRSASYGYDALYRLTSALTTGSTNYAQWGLSWTYDRYGNRTAQTVTAGTGPSNSVTIDATTNRITGAGYGYDANGNMTADGLNSTMTYDAENRLVSLNSGAASYTYDGNGLRVQKSASGSSTVYIYSGSKVIAEYDNGAAVGSPSREYIYSGGALVVTIDGSGTKYHHADHLSVRVTTDSNSNVAGQQGHYPYGESWYSASTTTKWQFTTYERDSESANDYALARYSLNRLGRFSSPDPVSGSPGDPQSLNLFAYVRNEPIGGTDPTGAIASFYSSPVANLVGQGLIMPVVKAAGLPYIVIDVLLNPSGQPREMRVRESRGVELSWEFLNSGTYQSIYQLKQRPLDAKDFRGELDSPEVPVTVGIAGRVLGIQQGQWLKTVPRQVPGVGTNGVRIFGPPEPIPAPTTPIPVINPQPPGMGPGLGPTAGPSEIPDPSKMTAAQRWTLAIVDALTALNRLISVPFLVTPNIWDRPSANPCGPSGVC